MKPTKSEYNLLQKEMLKFREMMGNKEYWKLSDDGTNRKIELAFKGLFHIYMQTDKTDDERMHMEALVTEFTRRKILMELCKEQINDKE